MTFTSGKGAPESFGNISGEVLPSQAVFKQVEETLFSYPLPPSRGAGLKTVLDGCNGVPIVLKKFVDEYESLGTQAKCTWDRKRWGNEDIAEIRSRLASNVTLLTAFIK